MSHPVPSYAKPALTPQQHVANLRAKGLRIGSHAAAAEAMDRIGYYRLLIYMRPLQVRPGKTFDGTTTFEDVLSLYDFDRKPRLLCLDAIERVEVCVRSFIIGSIAVGLGPHFYVERRHFRSADAFKRYGRWSKG